MFRAAAMTMRPLVLPMRSLTARKRLVTALYFTGAAGVSLTSTPVLARMDSGSGKGQDILSTAMDVMRGRASTDDLAKSVGNTVNPILATGIGEQITFGFSSGFCSGFAFKKLSKTVAIVIGMGFMGLQALAYQGYIDVNYAHFEKGWLRVLDRNNDGKFDSKDVQHMYDHLMEVLEFNAPAGGGFTTGFLLGFRSG
jgi:uncharacterized membrane protein (Fun14 family)